MTHYFDKVQDSPFLPKKFSVLVHGRELEFFSASGVFSKDEFDLGSKTLLSFAIIKKEWNMLDFGCGWGIIGVAIALKYPNAKLTLSDINERAVQIAKMNVELHALKNCHVIQSNFFENIHGEFDTILVNPPQVAGKEACFRIIKESKQHLKSNGLLQLVARPNKGGKSYSHMMKETFGNVMTLGDKAGFSVYVSKQE